MKGNEVTRKDMIRWNKEGFFPVACRICGGVMLYPKEAYNQKDFVGWECGGALSVKCKGKACPLVLPVIIDEAEGSET